MPRFHVGQPVTLSGYGPGAAITEPHEVRSVHQGVVCLRRSRKMFDANIGEWVNDGSAGVVFRIDPAQ